MNKPRPRYTNAIERAIEGSRKLPPTEVAKAKAALLGALLSLQRTERPEFQWRCCADAFGIAEALAEQGICCDADSKRRIEGGNEALSAVLLRLGDGGSWTLRAEEIRALHEAVWLCGVQLDHCSMREYETAVRRTVERARQALAGNVGPGVTVLTAEGRP